ncbi:MAG: XRE family transcriptional regulator, partial [Chloroflexi bacterium]|nr:XRE family transcriptional regulator [Chloroflexota bacterium]
MTTYGGRRTLRYDAADGPVPMTSDAQGSNTFGVLLQRLRLEAGFSQEELAERAGLSRRGIADLERGARRSPRPSTVRRLSLGLGLDEGGRATLLAGARPNVHSGVTDTAGPPSLPVSSGPLVGRERELAEVRRLLGSTRLLTLTGAGGSGKTRLALEAARASADAYPDGTVLVLLASLTDAHMVAPAIANALGVRERAGVSVREVLAAYLRPRRMLLLLDNFEHLLDASQLVADLLATCPHLAVLATSREALRVHEEQEFPVLPLALPAEGDVSIPALRRCGSVQLFARRAAQACAAFAVTPDNARAVAAICARLDGLPLALELAAAWLKVLTPELLLWRLDRRLPLLAGGARDLPERQRTLRATIAWSDDLLDASDRCLFQRLAVCSGGCTLEAAETLGASVASPDRPVLKALAALVDKNLLQRQGDAGAEPRFTMLETIREYALEQLWASGELDQARQMHAAYYLTWLATADPRRSPTPTGGWVRRLDLEYDNLREAVRWCLDHRAISLVADAGTALTRYGIFRGHLREMRQWWEHALEQSVGAQPSVWPTVGFLLAMVLFLQGEPARVRPLLTESLARFRRQGDRRGTAHALLQLAYAELVDGNMTHEAVVPLLREAEGLFRELGQHEDVAWTLLGLGNAA